MILIDEIGVKSVEAFEEMVGKHLDSMLENSEPIEEREKLIFYSISRLFESCSMFRHFMIGSYLMILSANRQGKLREFLDLISLVAKTISEEDGYELEGGDKE